MTSFFRVRNEEDPHILVVLSTLLGVEEHHEDQHHEEGIRNLAGHPWDC